MTRRELAIGAGALAFGLAMALALAEIGVRSVGLVNPGLGEQLERWDPFAVKVAPVGELGYRQRPNVTLRYRNGVEASSNGLGYRGPEVEIPKPPGHFRVILLGGSTTHGWGVPDSATIDAFMRKAFHHRWPDRTVEVVNLAFDGYDAHQLVERLQYEGLGYEPDVIVVNSGINDVRNARIPNLEDRDPRTLLFETELQRLREEQARGGPRLRHTLRHLSYTVRLVTMVRNNWHRRRGDIPTGSVPPNEIEAYPEAAANFERNLHRLAALAADRGIPLVYSVPPSSLKENYDPSDTARLGYWLRNAEETQAYRDTLAGRMRHVTDSLRATGYPAAMLHATLPSDVFLDDCHLTAEGNRLMADRFVEAITPWLDTD